MDKPGEPASRLWNPVITAVLILAGALTIGFVLEFVGDPGRTPQEVTDQTTVLFLGALVKTDGKLCTRALSATRATTKTGETVYVLTCSSGQFRITMAQGKETTVQLIP